MMRAAATRTVLVLAIVLCAGSRARGAAAASAEDGAGLSAEQREVLFKKLLAGYCGVISKSRDSAPIPVKLAGWPALQVPSSSIMGLVLLGEGNTRTKGPHARCLDKLYTYVATASSKKEALRSHESWTLAFAILFLSEVHRVEPSAGLRNRIAGLVKLLETGRHGEKGWYHSLKSTDYGPFVGVTIWCTAALAAAAEQGVPVDKAGLAMSLKGLSNSLSKTGGGFYFTYKQNSHMTPGRAGGVAWVLTRYGDPKDPKIAAARSFLVRNADAAPAGHASWMMNMGWAALGASSADEATRKAFWKVHRPTIFKTRAADGFFRVQKWTETGFGRGKDPKAVKLGESKTWPDPMYGDAWATVWMFLVWQAERGKCVLTPKLPGPAVVADPKSPAKEAFDEAAIIARIRKGQTAEVRKDLYALMRKSPNDARLYRLRACTYVPALLEPFPLKAKTFIKGWGYSGESRALRDLVMALSKKEGKGDLPNEFNGEIHWLRAKIHAKRALSMIRPKSTSWVSHYNAFGREIKAMLKFSGDRPEAYDLLQVINARARASKPTGRRDTTVRP